MDKENLRQKMLAKRAELTDEQVEEASQQIFERTIMLPQVADAHTVLVYADFGREVRTGELTGWLLYKGKTVALPVVKDDVMRAVAYRGGKLDTAAFGYPVPAGVRKVISPTQIDLVICPGVAFTRGLDRIGFGKGCYDRFLSEAPKAYRIGLAYAFQVVDKADVEAHDIRMNAIVTPDGVLT